MKRSLRCPTSVLSMSKSPLSQFGRQVFKNARNGTKSIATRSKKLLGAPGLTTSNKKLLGTRASLLVTKGIATRSKDATRGFWPYYY